MPMHLLLLSLVLLQGNPSDAGPICMQVLHSKTTAMKLSCCIFQVQYPQQQNYSSTGTCSPTQKCYCLLEVWADQLQKCRLTPPAVAVNHSLHSSPSGMELVRAETSATLPLTSNCQSFLSSIPGKEVMAELSVKIQHWKQSEFLELLLGISKHNVIALTVDFNGFSPSLQTELFKSSKTNVDFPNLGLFLPRLKYLNIGQQENEKNAKQKVHLLSTSFLRDLSQLEILKVTNVDFVVGMEHEEALWTRSIQLIHIENTSLSELPWWLIKCQLLERLLIRGSQLQSALVLSQISSLVYLGLKGNQLEDLSHVSFSCERVQEIDLSENFLVKIAPHTFRQCVLLRSLDLSHNFLDALPEKGFMGNGRLKHLKLKNNRIRLLRPDHLAGLQGLRSLILSGNPLQDEEKSQGVTASGIEPFALLPVKWIRILELDDCLLTSIPLAVTQCCLLNSLSLNSNRLYARRSMPAEILALLSRLTYLAFERNPLKELPPGLFLFPTTNEAAIAHILDTLIQLPVWLDEPCTPFLWHLHLRNSSYEMRQKVAGWNVSRMHREKLGHCHQLYETIIEGQAMYRELAENSGCEASRKLRSAKHFSSSIRMAAGTARPCSLPKQSSQEAVTSGKVTLDSVPPTVHYNVVSHDREERKDNTYTYQARRPSTTYLMLTSMAVNFGLFLVLVVKVVKTASRRILLSPSFCNLNRSVKKPRKEEANVRTPLNKTANEEKPTLYTAENVLNG